MMPRRNRFASSILCYTLFIALALSGCGSGSSEPTRPPEAPTIAPSPLPTAAASPSSSPSPTVTLAPAPTATSAPALAGECGVVICDLFYDGAVPRVESDEYCEIRNDGPSAVNLVGWRLNAGAPEQDFVFPDYVLEPGRCCRVYTNEVHRETGGLSFGSGQALWHNKSDCGYLYDAAGNLVSEWCY